MEFVVNREKWARGFEPADTYLLSKRTGKMCCLGFCSLALGATRKEITNKKYPAAIGRAIAPLSFTRGHVIDDSELATKAAVINDAGNIGDAERERRLIKLFGKYGHTIRFE